MPESNQSESNIEKAFKSLLRGGTNDFDAHLITVAPSVNLVGTKAILHCHHIQLDGNGIPKVRELLDSLVNRVADYAIPRIEINRAHAKDLANSSNAASSELHRRAARLFVESDCSGEVGEVLLYCLIQSKLRIPQILCKMSLKTNANLHFNGIDGIHATIEPETGQLAFYWAESKLHKDIGGAVSDCLDSILPFLYEPPSTNGRPRRERDLELVRADLSKLDNSVLEDALLNYLDPNHTDYNKVNFRGACLVGFDCKNYPEKPNELTTDKVAQAVKTELETQWKKRVGDKITDRSPLETFHLEVFLVPMPDIEAFRTGFVQALKS